MEIYLILLNKMRGNRFPKIQGQNKKGYNYKLKFINIYRIDAFLRLKAQYSNVDQIWKQFWKDANL